MTGYLHSAVGSMLFGENRSSPSRLYAVKCETAYDWKPQPWHKHERGPVGKMMGAASMAALGTYHAVLGFLRSSVGPRLFGESKSGTSRLNAEECDKIKT
jgi:hypothetical protein